jgi:hypothetical protein
MCGIMGLFDYLQIFFYRLVVGFIGLVVLIVGGSIIASSAYTTGTGYIKQTEYNMWIAIPGLFVFLLGIGIMGYAASRKQP